MRSLAVSLLSLVLLGGLAPAAQGQARIPDPLGSDPFRAGHAYRGDFPDPAVLRVGSSFFAYATATNRLNLPVASSRDLTHWRANRALPDGSPDGMPVPARWAWSRPVGARQVGMNWAPSVERIRGRYVVAYATRLPGRKHKMCISAATSASPRGPFVDRSRGPMVCPKRRGAIDPQLFKQHGKVWLLYKTEDISIGKRTRIWVQRLGPRGLRTAAAPPTLLLTAGRRSSWENRVVENPAMIVFRGYRYLFYSGNGWGSKQYAIGYAICKTVKGPCQRPVSEPLLARNDRVNGPGGGFVFLGRGGGLRLAYHAWDKGFSHYPHSAACRHTTKGCAQRRLHVARLVAGPDGLLTVADLG